MLKDLFIFIEYSFHVKERCIIQLFLPASIIFKVTRLNKSAVLLYPELFRFFCQVPGLWRSREFSFSSEAPFLVDGICVFLWNHSDHIWNQCSGTFCLGSSSSKLAFYCKKGAQ